jgi:ribonuclease T
MCDRFRGFLPVVIDVETGGFIASTDAILEVAATTVRMDENGLLQVHRTYDFHVQPFTGANIEQSALEFTGIDPYHPFREAVAEQEALEELFGIVRKEIRDQKCTRAILVGHNAHFDAGFINAAVARCDIKRTPPRCRAWRTAKQCWPRPARKRVSRSTTARRTPRRMTPSARRNSFARSSIAGRNRAAGCRTSTETP